MSGDEHELSLSEMRMLTSSVVHMDVRQIALCVVTIPKLKSAIQQLLHFSPPQPTQDTFQVKRRDSTVNGAATVLSWTDADSDVGASLVSEPPALQRKPSSNNSTELEAASPPAHIPLDVVLAENARGSTKFSMVGNKIAVGKPGKSKAKSDKRVKYITCRVCHLLFYKRDEYREHMRVHANDPNVSVYSCDHCSFVTKRRGVFNTHILRHTGDLPFKCILCGYAGRQVSLLRQHVQNKHPDYKLEDVNGRLVPVCTRLKEEPSNCEVKIVESETVNESLTKLLLPADT